MQRGLEGRRIALLGDDPKSTVAGALERAGATAARLDDATPEDQWHSGLYAALVLLGSGERASERGKQLVREFLVADKPVGALGEGLQLLRESGALEGRNVAASGSDPVQDENLLTASAMSASDFAPVLVRTLSQRLEERDLDEMSEASFPASDPPAVTPSSVGAHGASGRADQGGEPRAR